MDVPLEIRKQLYEAVQSDDARTIQRIGHATPGALAGGWSGGSGPGFLHLAARKGQLSACKALVELGLDVNVAESGAHSVPLDEAATAGHLRIVQWMLDRGASVDGLSTSVATPLMGAAIEGHLEIARVLLDAGAEINREHLRLPQTALDFAELYKVKQSGQDAVAALLRERGGIRPYLEKHDWNGVPGRLYIEHIERAVSGFVNPLAISQIEVREGTRLSIYKVRIPKKYEYQLLFTVGLASTGSEIALCLPSAWPLNRAGIQESRFNWPIQLLNRVGAAKLAGVGLVHGQVMDVAQPALAGIEVGEGMNEWVVTLNQTIEAEHEGDFRISRTILLVPITAKKPMKTRKQASTLADRMTQAKWDKIALDLPTDNRGQPA